MATLEGRLSIARNRDVTPSREVQPKSVSPEVRATDIVAQGAIEAADFGFRGVTGPTNRSWISTREDRYMVTLGQLSSFSCDGSSLAELINRVDNPALKTAFITLKRVEDKTYDSFAVRTFHFSNFNAALRSVIEELTDLSSFDFKVATELCSALFTVDIRDTSFGERFINNLLGDYRPATVQDFDATRLERSLKAGLSGKTIHHKVTDLRRKLSASNPRLPMWQLVVKMLHLSEQLVQ